MTWSLLCVLEEERTRLGREKHAESALGAGVARAGGQAEKDRGLVPGF